MLGRGRVLVDPQGRSRHQPARTVASRGVARGWQGCEGDGARWGQRGGRGGGRPPWLQPARHPTRPCASVPTKSLPPVPLLLSKEGAPGLERGASAGHQAAPQPRPRLKCTIFLRFFFSGTNTSWDQKAPAAVAFPHDRDAQRLPRAFAPEEPRWEPDPRQPPDQLEG